MTHEQIKARHLELRRKLDVIYREEKANEELCSGLGHSPPNSIGGCDFCGTLLRLVRGPNGWTGPCGNPGPPSDQMAFIVAYPNVADHDGWCLTREQLIRIGSLSEDKRKGDHPQRYLYWSEALDALVYRGGPPLRGRLTLVALNVLGPIGVRGERGQCAGGQF